MPFDFSGADQACLSAFGIPATLYPQDGGQVLINGIVAPVPVLEQVLPGGADGVTNVYFFVRSEDIDPKPQAGDVVCLSRVNYNIVDVLVDAVGSATLKLRRNS